MDNFVTVTIADTHTNVISIEENGITIVIDKTAADSVSIKSENPFKDVTTSDIYDFAINAPIEDLEFIELAAKLNDNLSIEGLSHKYGLQIGRTFQKNTNNGLLDESLLTQIITRTAAASDARMGGATLAAMSNSGSGNQGIAATMPVVVAAEFLKVSHEKMIRSLIMSHLMAIYIKSYQRKLSALCGATTASMGASAAITWLLGGDLNKINHSICSMIGDLTGMICDGAKASCAMKVSTSVGTAFKSALLAIDDIRVTGNEGVVDNNVDQTIRNLAELANGSMVQTDEQILEIMLKKA